MAGRCELHERAAPEGFVAKGLGIEADGKLAAIAEAYADSLGHDHVRTVEYAAHERVELRLVPPRVYPARLILISPVPLAPSVETRKGGEQRRDVGLLL